MKNIIIRKDFSVNDISDEEDVQAIVDKINIENDTDVQLDLSGCLIDYPATSMLVDKILEQMFSMTGVKKLQIITDYILPISTLINWILLGSKKLELVHSKELTPEEIQKIIETVLKPLNITLTITIRDKSGVLRKELTI